MVTSLANNNNNSVYSETHGDDVQKESPSRPQPESHSNSSPYEYNSGASYNRQQSRAYWGSNAGMSNQWQYYNPSSEMMYPHHAYYSQHEGSYPSYRSQQHPNYATPYGPPSAYSYGTYSATSAAIQSPSKRRRVMDESATETNHDPVAHYIPNSTKSTSRHKTSPGNHHFSFDEPLKIPNSTTKSTSRHKASPGNHHFTFDDPLHDMEPAPLTGSASGTTPYDDVDYSTAPYPYYNGSAAAAAAAAQSYTYPTSSYHYHTNHLHQDVDHHSNYYHYQNGHPYYHQHNGHNNPNSPKVLVSPDTQSNKTELDKLRHDNPFEGLDNNNNSNDNVNHDGENGIQHPAAPSPMNKSSKLSDRKAMQSKAWYDRFEDLKKYKEEHGDCMVPQKYPPNPRYVALIILLLSFCKLM